MSTRRSLLVVAAALVLALLVNVIVWSLYRHARSALEGVLDQRLDAMGHAAARLLPAALDKGRETADGALADLARAQRLEGATLLGADFVILADARGARAPSHANLMTLDADRLRAAQGGSAAVGWGYNVEGIAFQSGYFPLPASGGVLVLEAGLEWSREEVARVRTAYIAAALGSTMLGLLAAIVAWLALRSLERARLRYGRSERLAAVGQMAAMVAHEVRNPLGSIRAGVEVMREGLPASSRDVATDVLEEVDRIGTVTEEFLALARGGSLRVARCDVAALVREVARTVARDPVTADVRIEARGPEEGLDIVADEARLRRVLANLVLNAAQIGGGGTNVLLEARAIAGGVEVRVVDDGPGVPAAMRARLFEPFVSGRAGGTGLGLALSKRIVEQHGGTLDLVPTRRGATFRLFVPPEPPLSGE